MRFHKDASSALLRLVFSGLTVLCFAAAAQTAAPEIGRAHV